MRLPSSPRFATPRLERLEARETPTAGLLDPSFGTAGLVLNSTGANASTLAVQADGKLLVGGNVALNPPGPLFSPAAVFRFKANGSLDSTFGTHGVAFLPAVGGFGFQYVNQV